MGYINVAIDGPSGAGKSSVSKALAKRLGFIYIDTGAMYRAAALYAIENGIAIIPSALIPHLDEIKINIKHIDAEQRIFLSGRDVSERIREKDVTIGSSDIAVIPEVREKLVEIQRKLAADNSVIMDGRDIGTCVLPRADLKVFLTASADARAKRRYAEMSEKGMECDFETVKADMEYRDKNDSSRAASPCVMAPDAILIDSSELSFDEVVESILKLIREKM